MSQEDQDIDARLGRLAGATQGINPSSGFSLRVMQRIGEESLFSLAALHKPARRFFPVGVLAAAMALVWAVSVDRQVDEALASSDDVAELSW